MALFKKLVTKQRFLLILSFNFFLGIISTNCYGQGMALPAKMQATLFKKVFAFDKTLSSKGSFDVAILGASGEAVAAAFKETGIEAKPTGNDQIPNGVNVVYVMPNTASPKAQSATRGVLSISGVTEFVESGKVAIGIGTDDGKTKIFINMAQLKAEGHELSADLLKIAKIIQ